MTMKLRLPLFVCSAAIACLSAGSSHAQPTPSQIYQGLVSYWPMDTITGGTTPDAVSGINLNAVNSPTTTTGQFGNAIQLSGTAYLSFTDSAVGGGTNNLGSGLPYYAGTPFTMAMWVKAAAQTGKYLFALGNTTAGNPLYCIQTGNGATYNDKLDFIMRNLAGVTIVSHAYTASDTFFDGSWHHLAWVDNYGVISIYKDGTLLSYNTFSYYPDMVTEPTAMFNSTTYNYIIPFNTTTIGALVRSSAGGQITGAFDDVGVWNRALSGAEVQYIHQNGIPAYSASYNPGAPGFAVALPSFQTNALGDYVVLQANAYGAPPLSLQWYEDGSAILNATNQTLQLYNLTSPGTHTIYVTAHNSNAYVTTPVTNGPMSLVVPPDPSVNLPYGCYGYWPLDTINGSTTPDTYFGNNFNLAGSPGQVSGQFNTALSFNGSTSYAYLSGSPPALYYTNYSISFWVNAPGSVQQASGMAFENGNSGDGSLILSFGYSQQSAGPGNRLAVYLRGGAGGAFSGISQLTYVMSASTVFDSNWHHVTWVDKAGSVTLYVDGNIDPVCFAYVRTNTTAQGALRLNQAFNANCESLGCGWRNGGKNNPMACSVDEVAWWNRALSYSEVQALQGAAVPAQTVLVAPVIGTQPSALPNAYVGDTNSFSVILSIGSTPLSYQWYYTNNGTTTPINASLNPSAATASLVLANVQTGDAGQYFVIVTNGAAPGSGYTGGGAATSTPALLVVHNYTPSSTNLNSTILQVEFNAVSAPGYVQPGFQSMTLSNPSMVISNATKVTLSAIGGAILSDRSRNVTSGNFPYSVTNNPPAMTTALLYNSFIFDTASTLGTGLDLLVQHLVPNTQYGVNLWSYDPDSNLGGTRGADWFEVISNTTIANPYTFNALPTAANDWQETLGALLTSDPNGQLDIQGTVNALYAGQVGVFVNALTLTANPRPVILSAVVAGDGNLLLTAQAQYSGQTLYFQESSDLVTWQDATDGINATQNGPIVTSEFPLSANKMFYRVATQP